MSRIIQLSQRYTSFLAKTGGGPWVERVEVDIFQLRYFTECMQCNFCYDSCCKHEGATVDLDVENVARLKPHTESLLKLNSIDPELWFSDEIEQDLDFPSAKCLSVLSNENDDACVFLDRSGRGCLIHRHCLEQGIDYHTLKPMYCWLFPLEVKTGLLCRSFHPKVRSNTLPCLHTGPTFYQGVREELLHVFPKELVLELDAVAASLQNQPNPNE